MSLIKIDMENAIVYEDDGVGHPMGTQEAFSVLSRAVLRCGWDTKYVYSFTWMGRPIIQLPDDMFRLQEVIYQVKPDVIIEIGIAHGGSLIFSASLCKAMGKGRVVAVDIEIRPHNRKAIEEHELSPYITMFEGDSIAKEIVSQIRDQIDPGESVIAFLDGCHTKSHVLSELEAYGPMITPGSYIVAMDGIQRDLVGAPRSNPDWDWNNPHDAAIEFVARHENFLVEEPVIPFNEGSIRDRIMTYWPGGFIKRLY